MKWYRADRVAPQEEISVIVTVCDNTGDSPYYYTTVAWLYNGTWFSDNSILFGEVTYWMPLPKPCKGEENV